MNTVYPVGLQIFIHIFNIVIILIATTLISIVASKQRYRPFILWVIPVGILLAISLTYRAVSLWDLLDGFSIDPTIYELASDIIHSVDKVTIIIYAITLLSLDKKNRVFQAKVNELFECEPMEGKDHIP